MTQYIQSSDHDPAPKIRTVRRESYHLLAMAQKTHFPDEGPLSLNCKDGLPGFQAVKPK